MKKTNKRAIHGWLNINKPYGMGSTQVVGAVKRILRPEKVGHAGTLDPLADGVLPIALGEATKTVAYMMDARKTYEFTVRWGIATRTDDAEGEVTATSDVVPDAAAIGAILKEFTGTIEQTPPTYSAIKVAGKRAYDLARAGEVVEMKPRQVTIYGLEVTGYGVWGAADGNPQPITHNSHATFRVVCSKGTYVRSLARDMAAALGTVGHVVALKRTQVGPFLLTNAISLDFLEEMVHKARESGGMLPDSVLLPVSVALDDIPALTVDMAGATRLRQGLPLMGENAAEGSVIAVCAGGVLVAICDCTDGLIKPKRVFNL